LHEGIIRRFEELIERGKSLPPALHGGLEWGASYRRWALSCLNILEKTFGKESQHYLSFKGYVAFSNRQAWVDYGIACMESAKEEVEKGLLYKIEHLISADFFDSILEHAEYLLSKGHKDPAAILGRVVMEKTLKHITERESIVLPEKVKLSKVNEILWKKEVYNKVTWRLIQGYIDLGNFAAHGDFDEYSNSEVEDMLGWIRKNLVNL
jgi:hypothetical protein